MDYDAVIFDNDGVLVDSERIAHGVQAAYLTELGYPTTVEESYRDFLGNGGHNVRTVIAERHGGSLPEDYHEVRNDRIYQAFRASLEPVPGAAELLTDLQRRGVAYCVASSSPHEWITLTLDLAGLRGRLPQERVFSSDDVGGVGKPAPDLFLHAAAALGVEPGRCLVVEDSANGVLAARAAGMDVFGYTALTAPEVLAAAGATGLIMRLEEVAALVG